MSGAYASGSACTASRVTPPQFQCRFRRKPDSIAFWDDRSVQRLAIPDYQDRRDMDRAALRDDVPYRANGSLSPESCATVPSLPGSHRFRIRDRAGCALPRTFVVHDPDSMDRGDGMTPGAAPVR
jgi:hypothetical protein